MLKEKSVEYMLMEKRQKEPLDGGKYETNYYYPGMKNKYNQIYLCRNGHFEPSIIADELNVQPIEKCLKSIERSFRLGKPAIIISHRVNYIGGIEEQNRTNSLPLLDQLLKKISTRWPDVEFMTSSELGDLISGIRS